MTRGDAVAFSYPAAFTRSISRPFELYFFAAMFLAMISVASLPLRSASSVMLIETEEMACFYYLGALVGRRAPSGIPPIDVLLKLLL